ncbi:hypothetical protein THTE_0632 [Thermogutta terrifontis]|jgi:hypothetical protein|uniref:Uncharacterized protein n=1 Tax=Thermogutta terrifontis TaxID=1331910 RepID=A0A286RB96_9BACT|nr:hypothetical protein THTE_0632 [Thermogutta terrifontis]
MVFTSQLFTACPFPLPHSPSYAFLGSLISPRLQVRSCE